MQGMGMIFSVGKWKGFTGFRWKGVKVMKRGVFLIILCIFSLFACSSQDSREWFETKEEAIDYGLRTSESGIPLKQLSIEEYQGETIVFYDFAGDLGIASITESRKGYSWYRSGPYLGFERGDRLFHGRI